MVTQKDIYPGSKWWKTDFHVHTPASTDYENKDVTEEDILKAAMTANLDCLVITDHNSGSWIDRLQAKNKEIQLQNPKPDWYRDLTIFPGVEITVADSVSRVHLLAIFDIGFNSQNITSVLGACGITNGFGDSQNTSTTKSFIETVEVIEAAGGIAIPAHIDGNNGLLYNKTTLNLETKKSLSEIIAAEFCDVNAFINSEEHLKKAVENIAKLGGSDAHKADEIGRHYSWIKMGTPSLTGLSLALMDHEYCVKNQENDPNHLPGIWFNKLEIRNMKYCGRINNQPFILDLNPGLNTFIGGRGSGKSTLLEAIRIAARRDLELAAEAPKAKEKLDAFISVKDGAFLPSTEIVLELWRNGKQFRLCWLNDSQGNVLEEKVDNNNWQPSEPGIIQERFPVSIFSQKQIEELASNPRGLLNLIDRSPMVNRSEWDSKWEINKSLFMQLREKERDLLRRTSEESQIRVKLADLENDLKQYEAKGHGEILKKYQQRLLQCNAIPTNDIFNRASASIRSLANTIGIPDFPVHMFDINDDTLSELKAIYEKASDGLKKVAENLEESAQMIEQIGSELYQSFNASKWKKSFLSVNASYAQLMDEYAQKGSELNLFIFNEWTQQYHQIQQQLQGIGSIKTELSDVQKQINDCYSCFFTLRDELLKNRLNFINSVIGSNPYVRMELMQYGDVSTLDEEYREIFNIERDTFSSSIQAILWEFQNWKDNNIPGEKIPELINYIKQNTINIANDQKVNIANIDNRLKLRLKDAILKQPAVFDQLCTWFPEDLLLVKYSKDPNSGKFDMIESGSAGQKAAAILAFLLSFGEQPLIIDQPEDDLDNSLIYDLIVRQIHENKTRRQLIIATHNPNIVVNGIAELIVSLKFTGGLIQPDTIGSLGSREVRNSICNILEGGEEALDKRYKRIRMKR
jgi:histidinol phosphatase-like PHP family hydrolase/energy-coupling factor transporter ATP-binding protein EcfA2